MAKSYMESPRNFYWNLKHYGLRLSQDEIKESIITILMIAFVLSFKDWGGDNFNFVVGATNFAVAILITAVAFFFNQVGQRWIAIYYGYNPEYKMSMFGLMIALVITFASRGQLIFITPGYILIHMLPASRLGEFRYYTNLWEWAKACFGGPLANFLVAVVLSVTPHKEIAILHKALVINIWFTIFSLLPLPFNPGMYMFFYYRWFWAFAVGMFVFGSVLILFTNGLIALIAGSLIGLGTMVWYFIKYDKTLNLPFEK